MKNITIGRYYPQNSIIHNLDPRTKLAGLLVYVILLFIVSEPLGYIPFLAVLLILYKLAKVPFLYLLKGLKIVIVLLVFTLIFRSLLTAGEEIAHFWIFSITKEGIVLGIRLASRIALMIAAASLLSYTTTPRTLADGIEKALSFLQKMGVNIRSLAVTVMIAFRFIPVMIEETNILMDAQAARGAEFENCSVWKKCRNVCTLLMPLFFSSVRRATDLAMAMEARGYKGDNSPTSRMYPLVYKKSDRVSYIVMLLAIIAFIPLKIIF